jgi:type II secretory pathway component PulK
MMNKRMRHSILKEKDGRNRRAAILVLTLWIVVVLGLISASMLEEIYLELKLAKFQRDDFEAMALARAGLARAVADVRNDLILDRSTQSEMLDTLSDVWARTDDDKVGKDNEGVPMGRGTYRVWVDDAANKFNLNMLNPFVLKAALYELGLQQKEVEEVAGAIMDWIDPNDDTEQPGTGKEDEYYSALVAKKSRTKWRRGEPPIYHCKNDRFSSVDELLSVYGVTPALFYGVDIEEETPPSPIEQLKSRTERARPTDARRQRYGLRDIFAVDSPGAINLNTADALVLRIAFRAALTDPKIAAAAVEKVLAKRKPASGGSSSDTKGFHNVMELITVAGLPPDAINRLMGAVQLTVRSDMYRIYALGEVKGTQHLICATVARSLEMCSPDLLNPWFERGLINARLAERFRRRHGDTRSNIEQTTVRVVQWQEL